MAERIFDEARREQGFCSQTHLDAFFAYFDHTHECEECLRPGRDLVLEDGSRQPTGQLCPTGRELQRAADAFFGRN